ncbi:MAG: TonB-dependent receptor [Gammaproteobacteria bacterium]|nr:TonB-dependent receptor [Gammaproteobacteria bacterium]
MALASQSAMAADELAIEEIMVTAKVRQQSLFDVPLSISVLDNDRTNRLGIRSLDDIDRWVPSLDIRTPSGRRSSTIVMRGLSPNTTNEQLRGVSIFVDGIYLSGSLASLRLQDLQRTEVIRGPQSTMFGRATYTGAIDLITRDPIVENISGRIGARYSQYSTGDTSRYSIDGRVDFPIVQDRLWGSVNVMIDDTDSFANTPSGSTGVGGEETVQIGGVLYWQANDDLSFKLRYAHTEDEDDTAFVHITHPDEWLANGISTVTVGNNTIWPSGAVMEPVAGVTECQPTFDNSSTSTMGTKDGIVDTPGAVGRGTPSDCGEEQSRDFLSLIATWNLNGYELSYRGAYFESDLDSNNDFFPRGNVDGLGVDPFFGPGNGVNPGGKSSFAFIATAEEFENMSHQIRIVSPSDRSVRWLGGFYYFEEENRNFRVDNLVPLSSWTGSITGVNRIEDRGRDKLENIAVFGQVEFDFLDTWNLSLEARLQEETIEKPQCSDCRQQSFPDQIGQDLEESETEFLPRATLTWMPAESQIFYVLYSEGTKSARFNPTEPSGFPFNFADFVYVKPEELDNYEIGAKNAFLDNRMRTSLALFIMEVENQQQSAQLPASTVAFTQNVSESTVKGFEFEALVNISEKLTANLAIGYADHEYDTDFVPGSSSDRRIVNGESLEGKTSPGVPKTTVNGGIQYETQAFGDYRFLARADISWRDKQYVDLANRAYVEDSSQLNLMGEFGNDTWSVSLFAYNVTDEEVSPGNFSGTSTCTYRNAAAGSNFPSPFQRCNGLGISRGREVGLSAVWNF